ncbi:hypothetical protein PROFUN_12381 [Planoprotostelium fungivorum]|uniref:Uncharacterized protein n=1 Tax=Planoprotostelium fungivorum TaxID=1890364 RepID=A0A2P6N7G0_9EUKA|nr:hypothetical protein PROFUN_12381 [Planoprotostelium fungivorum]
MEDDTTTTRTIREGAKNDRSSIVAHPKFLHDQRLWPIVAPIVFLLLSIGGRGALLTSALGLTSCLYMKSTNNSDGALLSIWVTLFAVDVFLVIQIFQLVVSVSIFYVFLLLNINQFLAMLGLWAALHFPQVCGTDYLNVMERILMGTLPFPLHALTMHFLSQSFSFEYALPYYTIIAAIIFHMISTPARSSYGNHSVLTSLESILHAVYTIIVPPITYASLHHSDLFTTHHLWNLSASLFLPLAALTLFPFNRPEGWKDKRVFCNVLSFLSVILLTGYVEHRLLLTSLVYSLSIPHPYNVWAFTTAVYSLPLYMYLFTLPTNRRVELSMYVTSSVGTVAAATAMGMSYVSILLSSVCGAMGTHILIRKRSGWSFLVTAASVMLVSYHIVSRKFNHVQYVFSYDGKTDIQWISVYMLLFIGLSMFFISSVRFDLSPRLNSLLFLLLSLLLTGVEYLVYYESLHSDVPIYNGLYVCATSLLGVYTWYKLEKAGALDNRWNILGYPLLISKIFMQPNEAPYVFASTFIYLTVIYSFYSYLAHSRSIDPYQRIVMIIVMGVITFFTPDSIFSTTLAAQLDASPSSFGMTFLLWSLGISPITFPSASKAASNSYTTAHYPSQSSELASRWMRTFNVVLSLAGIFFTCVEHSSTNIFLHRQFGDGTPTWLLYAGLSFILFSATGYQLISRDVSAGASRHMESYRRGSLIMTYSGFLSFLLSSLLCFSSSFSPYSIAFHTYTALLLFSGLQFIFSTLIPNRFTVHRWIFYYSSLSAPLVVSLLYLTEGRKGRYKEFYLMFIYTCMELIMALILRQQLTKSTTPTNRQEGRGNTQEGRSNPQERVTLKDTQEKMQVQLWMNTSTVVSYLSMVLLYTLFIGGSYLSVLFASPIMFLYVPRFRKRNAYSMVIFAITTLCIYLSLYEMIALPLLFRLGITSLDSFGGLWTFLKNIILWALALAYHLPTLSTLYNDSMLPHWSFYFTLLAPLQFLGLIFSDHPSIQIMSAVAFIVAGIQLLNVRTKQNQMRNQI